MLAGYKKILALILGMAAIAGNHTGTTTTSTPDIDKLLAALSALYMAIEGLKDAVHGIAVWWNVTLTESLPRPPGVTFPDPPTAQPPANPAGGH
jgi:hypothetical protein